MIEVKLCSVDPLLLQKSNEIWNLLALNAPWSVGLTSYLIRQAHFLDYQAWKQFYFSSGDERLQLIGQLKPDIQEVLLKASPTHARLVLGDLSNYEHLTHRYGRSTTEFVHKAEILSQGYYAQTGEDLLVEEAQELIEHRVLGETWNGIYIRETLTIAQLKTEFPQVSLKPISAQLDYLYGVDYLIFMEEQLIAGLQIKPLSYGSQKPYVQKAKAANNVKNAKFTEVYGKPVFTILCSQQGEIRQNKESLSLYEVLVRL